MRRFAPPLFAQLFCIFAILLSRLTCAGQTPKPSASQVDIQYREWALENVRRDVTQPSTREQLVAQVALKQDFRDLQITNNELMKRRFENPTPELTRKEIRSSLEKIKSLAKRLKANLALPSSPDEKAAAKSKPTYNVTLSPGLLMLDKVVMHFVDNPMFQQPQVLDSVLALQAGRDVNEIVHLTDFLRELTKENSSGARR
ncbi:MAG: hypothetical protein C5B55_04600 [Blastocatellia bacterium]|nr:MAG: hypothetical protein C5B55_04600 [Blastocatellia bacterium]